VKVKCRKDLGKGIVDHVHDGKSVASVNFSGTMINVHQSELEKILPRIGAKVCIVAGQCVGQAATLLSVDTARRKVILNPPMRHLKYSLILQRLK